MINPMALVQQMVQRNPQMNNNPMFSNAMQMAQRNDVQGLQKLAQNLCESKGVKLEDVQNQVIQRFRMK